MYGNAGNSPDQWFLVREEEDPETKREKKREKKTERERGYTT